jgi:hypothetical protein
VESTSTAGHDAVILALPESLPEHLYLDFERELSIHHVALQIERKPAIIYASLEWAVPSLVAAYLVKPFLETLLKKAAEDAYPSIKSGVKKLLRSLFGPARESGEPRISALLAVYFESRDGYWVKALIWEGIPANLQEEAIDKLFELIEKHYTSVGIDRDFQPFLTANKSLQWGKLFLRFNLERRNWESVDILKEAQLRHQGSASSGQD